MWLSKHETTQQHALPNTLKHNTSQQQTNNNGTNTHTTNNTATHKTTFPSPHDTTPHNSHAALFDATFADTSAQHKTGRIGRRAHSAARALRADRA
jgi:hypothetical protein